MSSKWKITVYKTIVRSAMTCGLATMAKTEVGVTRMDKIKND